MDRTDFLKKLIESNGFNIKTFSEYANIPYTTLYSILDRGISKASVDNVIKICKSLGITIEELENISGQDGLHIELYIERYKKRLSSELAANLLNEDFLEKVSKMRNITIDEADFLLKQVILKDKIDFTGVRDSGQKLLKKVCEEIISNDNDIQKNICKACLLYTVKQIEENNYYKGDLGILIAKAKNYLQKYPEFVDFVKDTELEFLLNDPGNVSDKSIIKDPNIRAIARAGESMTSEEAAELRKFAERLFPDAFKKKDS